MHSTLYADARAYDLLFDDRVDDVRFYTALAHGTVLELGAGTGRITLPLATAGCDVTAVEPAPAMREALVERRREAPAAVRERVRVVGGSACTLDLAARFDYVLFPFNGLAHLHTAAELDAFFAGVRKHLAPSGFLAFDVWVPEPRLLLGEGIESGRFPDPFTGEPVTLREEFSYDALAQVLTTTLTLRPVLDPSAARTWSLSQRQFFPEETRLLLQAHGFELRWRTSRWNLPGNLSAPCEDDAPPEARGAMLAYVCAPR